jgi:dihydrolipoamide dehydrogenase
MAQAFRRLGASEVTIVEAEEQLLGGEEPFVGVELADAFSDEGIEVITGVALARAEREGSDGPVTGHLEDGRSIEADELLVAVGRQPATSDIGLEVVGLEPGEVLATDDHLRVQGVDGDWLYAVGDVNGRAELTHHGKYQARLLGDHLAGIDVDPAWADHDLVTRVVFTDPHVAATGLTEAQARERGVNVRAIRHDLGDLSGGRLMGKGYGGTAQLVIDQDRRVVVGATFVAPGAAELLHAASIAIASEISMARLWHAIPAFPTVSEVWLDLLENDRRLTLFG